MTRGIVNDITSCDKCRIMLLSVKEKLKRQQYLIKMRLLVIVIFFIDLYVCWIFYNENYFYN